MSADYPRDLIGYANNPPHPHWPGDARIALSFVLNYEEGGERNVLHGDKESEAFLSEMVSAQPLQGQRNLCMESLYEYGSRTGVWRLLNLFKKHDIPLTIFAVAMAAQRHPEAIRQMVAEDPARERARLEAGEGERGRKQRMALGRELAFLAHVDVRHPLAGDDGAVVGVVLVEDGAFEQAIGMPRGVEFFQPDEAPFHRLGPGFGARGPV